MNIVKRNILLGSVIVFGLLVVILIVTIDANSISKEKAITISQSYLETETPSFLLDHAYLIDTEKEKITDIENSNGKVWFVRLLQGVETTAIFYLNSEDGSLIEGYIINRSGERIKEFH
ncbi:hypothetical protein ACERII_16775 [Evansella sp. AB-rgal1]|uniref:hypothetical protein n=1 Tax=Evansella sp. AB-rgal1 TaxID=3242696 RepID=UPI00359E310B